MVVVAAVSFTRALELSLSYCASFSQAVRESLQSTFCSTPAASLIPCSSSLSSSLSVLFTAPFPPYFSLLAIQSV